MSNGTSGRLDRVLAAATLAGRPSGPVLRLERLALRINQKSFAKFLGMSRQRLDELERREKVTDELIERYRAGLRMIVTIAPDDGRGATLANARDRARRGEPPELDSGQG